MFSHNEANGAESKTTVELIIIIIIIIIYSGLKSISRKGHYKSKESNSQAEL